MLVSTSTFAPFRVRSFRFQWPADLTTSWALEMETIILGWYVLVETRSVFMLTVFASLLYVGTLLSPMFGVAGDRIGQRALLIIMRSVYAVSAMVLMASALLDLLTPTVVLGVTLVVGLVRPSDIGMRLALVGKTLPHSQLISAAGIQRTTMESARIAGALTGAGLVTTLGIGQAYIVVVLFYLVSIVLMAKSGPVWAQSPAENADAPRAVPAVRPSLWGSLKDGFIYAWNTPPLFAILLLAFLLNCTAFPLTNHLMPVVAKDIYQADQETLGYMVAALSAGALTGSLLMSRFGHRVSAARATIVFSIAWFVMLIVFAHMPTPAIGIPTLALVGLTQSLGLVPSAAILLRHSDQSFHGRIMGIRMLAIYGNLPGLLLSGPLITSFGYPATATTYCAVGIVFTIVIALRWRAVLWQTTAPANIK